MLNWIVASSLRQRLLVCAFAVALVALALVQVRRMPVDVFPEFAPPVVEVQTEAIGLSADEVESMITYSLEELLSGVPWIESTRSRSVTGLSSVLLIFKRGTDIYKARQMVQERLALAYTLPNVASPPVILQPNSATSRFMMVSLSSDTIESTELSLLARWTIKPKLVGVPGVSNVSVWGQKLRQLHVHFDPNRLRDNRVMQDDIIAATGDALWVSPLTYLKSSSPGSGGWIDNHNQRLGVEHAMPIETPEDMAKIAVTSPHLLLAGRSMALGDITETTFSHAPVIGDAIVGKGGKGLMLVLEKFPGTNTLEVTERVEQALTELKRGLPGVQVDSQVFRLADYVQDSISNFVRALLAGVVLMVLVLGAWLGRWRSVLVGALTLPVALLAALLVLHALGATLNTMILAGLVVALGVVIDGAVTDAKRLTEALATHRAAGETPASAVLAATLRTQRTALYATLIAAVAALPIYFLGDVASAFLGPLAQAYLLALGAALLVALTLTPALSLLVGSRAPAAPAPAERWLDGQRERYAATLTRALAAPKALLLACAAVVALAAVAWPLVNHSLLPKLKERQLLVNWTTAPGTSHAETQRITAALARELEAVPGVRQVGAHVGRAVTGDQVVGINASQVWVSLDPAADHEATVSAVRAVVDGYPGIEHDVQTYLRDKVGEVLTGQSRQIVVRIFGPQREVLRQKAEEVRKAMASIPGIVDLAAEGQTEEPFVQVKVNLEAAGRANVKPGDVRRSAASIFSGLVVGYLFKDQRIFEVVVWGAPEARQSLDKLSDLWVEKSDRSHARLGDIADVKVAATPTMLKHEGRAPYVDVVANVSGRSPSSVAEDVARAVAGVSFPLETHPELLGEYADSKKANLRLAGAAAVTLVLVGLLLQACLRNWALAGIGLIGLLTAMAGGVLTAAATGQGISLGTLVGLLGVLGLATRQQVTLLSGLQQAVQGPPQAQTLAQGMQGRLYVLLAGAAVLLATLLPLALAGAVPGLEVVRPTVLVMMGGAVVSTLVALFVTPAAVLALGAATAPRETDLSEPAALATPAAA